MGGGVRSILRTLRGEFVVGKTTESCGAISNTFHNVVEKRNPFNLKIDAGVAFVSAKKYIISIKNNEGTMLVSAHASTVYAM
jgi:hypothetical protein